MRDQHVGSMIECKYKVCGAIKWRRGMWSLWKGQWLSGCHNSGPKHWQLKPVSLVWLLAIASSFAFLFSACISDFQLRQDSLISHQSVLNLQNPIPAPAIATLVCAFLYLYDFWSVLQEDGQFGIAKENLVHMSRYVHLPQCFVLLHKGQGFICLS